jgi:hypothetical protein
MGFGKNHNVIAQSQNETNETDIGEKGRAIIPP